MPRISIGGTRELTVTATANISGQPIVVTSGLVEAKISGETVIISGQPVAASVSGQPIVVTSGLVEAKISGQQIIVSSGTVVSKVSGESIIVTSGTVVARVSGQVVDLIVPTDIIATVTTNPMAIPSVSGGTPLTSAQCISVVVKSLSMNSGHLYLGGYTSGQMPYSGYGFLLEPGEAVNIDIDNTGKVRVFAAVSGDKVTWIANK